MQSYYLFQSSLVLHEILKHWSWIELGEICSFVFIFVIKGQMMPVFGIYMLLFSFLDGIVEKRAKTG